MKVRMKVEYYPGDTGEFLKVDEQKCIACGRCAQFCTRDVWVHDADVYRPQNIIKCVECGACWNICPVDAVIFSEPHGGTGVRFTHG